MNVEGTPGPYQEVDVQALAVAVVKDETPDGGFLKDLDAASGGMINSVIVSEEFKGKEGETAYLHLQPSDGLKAQRLLLIGVGDKQEYQAARVSEFAGTAARFLRGKNVKSIAVLPRLEGDPEVISARAVEGAIIGLFEIDKYRTSDKEQKVIDRLVIIVDGADSAALTQGVRRGQIVGDSVNFTRDMANEPGAYLTPTNMAERAQEIASEFNLSIDVLDEARML
jgi:leucyl aminopeptidase